MKNKKVEKDMPKVEQTPEFVSWTKATLEEKIERCHFVIKDMMEALNKLQNDHNKLEANFFNHKHVDNVLMHQMTQFGGMGQVAGKEKDTRTDEEKWF